MSFFARLANLWNGFLSVFISGVEQKNPEAVYESAINERIAKHQKLKTAVSGIVFLRNKLTAELEDKEKQLREVNAQIPVALDSGDDEVAMVLLQKKNELEPALVNLKTELEKVIKQAEEAKDSLVAFRADIEKLRREKDEMLAKRATAQARIQIQETLDGLSTDADIKALESVRESIGKLQARADVGDEIKADSLDSRLAKIKSKTVDLTAKAQLEEMKRLRASQQAQQLLTATPSRTM